MIRVPYNNKLTIISNVRVSICILKTSQSLQTEFVAVVNLEQGKFVGWTNIKQREPEDQQCTWKTDKIQNTPTTTKTKTKIRAQKSSIYFSDCRPLCQFLLFPQAPKLKADEGEIISEVSRRRKMTPTKSVGLPCMSHRPEVETATCQHTHTHKKQTSMPRRDSNPQSQQKIGLRPSSYTVWRLGSAILCVIVDKYESGSVIKDGTTCVIKNISKQKQN
jgi:hypothetical protein